MAATGFKSTGAERRTGRAALRRTVVMSTLVGALLLGGAAGATSAFADTPVTDVAAVTDQPLTTASGDASGGDDQMSIQSSRRFTIYNHSGHQLRLSKIEGDQRFEGAPSVGQVIQPGGSQIVEVTYVYASTQRDDFTYDVLGDDGSTLGTVKAHLELKSIGIWEPSKSTSASVSDSNLSATSTTSDSVTFMDKANTTHTVAATSAQGSSLLAQYCGGGTPSATCAFAPTGVVKDALGPRHLVGTPVYNNTARVSNWTEYRTDETQSVTNNIEVSGNAEFQITKAVKLGVSTTYGYSWTDSVSRGQTLHVEFDPYTLNWVDSTNPVVRYTGDFTVKLGNTTWKITGATYEVPDPTRSPGYVMQSRPMTDQEKRDLAPTVQTVTAAALAEIE